MKKVYAPIFHDMTINFTIEPSEFTLISNTLVESGENDLAQQLLDQKLSQYFTIDLHIHTKDFKTIMYCLLSVASRTRGDISQWNELVRKLHTQAQEQGAVEVREEYVGPVSLERARELVKKHRSALERLAPFDGSVEN